MVEESPTKRVTRGIYLHDNIMDDYSSFSLGVTQQVEAITGSLAKTGASEEVRSTNRNDTISQHMSSKKKRRADEIASSSSESKKIDGSSYDKLVENEIEGDEVLFSPL